MVQTTEVAGARREPRKKQTHLLGDGTITKENTETSLPFDEPVAITDTFSFLICHAEHLRP